MMRGKLLTLVAAAGLFAGACGGEAEKKETDKAAPPPVVNANVVPAINANTAPAASTTVSNVSPGNTRRDRDADDVRPANSNRKPDSDDRKKGETHRDDDGDDR